MGKVLISQVFVCPQGEGIPRYGVLTPPRSARDGVPQARSGRYPRVSPPSAKDGVSRRSGQDRNTPGYLAPLARDGVPLPLPRPRTGQQSEHSMRDGRYASCVHAGGLSCCTKFTSRGFKKRFSNK